MRLCSATIASLTATLLLGATGCVAPNANDQGIGLNSAAAPARGLSPAQASMPPRALTAPRSVPLPAMQAPMNVANTNASVSQVGFFHGDPNVPACGCHGCGDSAGAASPHGYILQSPQGWNAHGVDPQEFVCDGGDQPPGAVLNRNDDVLGLQGEDTVAHYTTQSGEIEFEASNRTCLYAPRFSSVRKITGALAGGHAIGAAQFDRPLGPNRIEHELPGLVLTDTTELGHADVARRLDAMRERIRGVPVENVWQLEQAGDVMAALAGLSLQELGELQDEEKALYERLALAAVAWSLDESLEVVVEDLKAPTLTRDQSLQGLTVYEFPDDRGRLEVTKLADRADALPGDIVNFSIRVENVGDAAVTDVVLIDNLTTRLQYVDESQTCSADAQFDTVVNESQSLKLQWKLTNELAVGESAEIHFECKVR